MVLSASLHIKGHKLEKEGITILSCRFGFSQSVDSKGLTTSRVQGGEVVLSFNSSDDTEIVQWMMSEEGDKDGKITFMGENNTKPFKTVEFTDGRLVSYDESFENQYHMVTTLTISARQIVISGVKHTNTWSGYSSDKSGQSSDKSGNSFDKG
jgi:hypothetical protein